MRKQRKRGMRRKVVRKRSRVGTVAGLVVVRKKRKKKDRRKKKKGKKRRNKRNQKLKSCLKLSNLFAL